MTDGNTELVIKASAQLTTMRKWYICGDCDWPYLLIEKATKPPGGLEDQITFDHKYLSDDCKDYNLVKAAKTEAIPNTINPEFKTLNKKLFQIVCKGNKKTILKFTIKKFDNTANEHKEYGYFTSTIEIIERNSKATFRLHQNGEETD